MPHNKQRLARLLARVVIGLSQPNDKLSDAGQSGQSPQSRQLPEFGGATGSAHSFLIHLSTHCLSCVLEKLRAQCGLGLEQLKYAVSRTRIGSHELTDSL